MNITRPCQIISHVICCRTDCISLIAEHTLFRGEYVLQTSKPLYLNMQEKTAQTVNVSVQDGQMVSHNVLN